MELDYAYDVLMLSYGSPLEDVKRAYHLEAQLVHPDKLVDLPDAVRKHAEDRFKQVNEAYSSLSEYIGANGAPKKPEWNLNDEWNHRVAPTGTTANFVTDEAPQARMSTEEAFGMFMAHEQARGYNRIHIDRTTAFIIVGILYFALRSCSYISVRRAYNTPPRTVPDSVQVQPEDGQ